MPGDVAQGPIAKAVMESLSAILASCCRRLRRFASKKAVGLEFVYTAFRQHSSLALVYPCVASWSHVLALLMIVILYQLSSLHSVCTSPVLVTHHTVLNYASSFGPGGLQLNRSPEVFYFSRSQESKQQLFPLFSTSTKLAETRSSVVHTQQLLVHRRMQPKQKAKVRNCQVAFFPVASSVSY